MEIALAFIVIICASVMALESYQSRQRANQLNERVIKLEAANAKRLNYHAFEQLLDAMAALDKEKSEMEFHVSLIENAQGHLRNAMKIGTKGE